MKEPGETLDYKILAKRPTHPTVQFYDPTEKAFPRIHDTITLDNGIRMSYFCFGTRVKRFLLGVVFVASHIGAA